MRPAHWTLTALMMLVWPEPGIQPVTTITMSPGLKNPRALPDEDGERECHLPLDDEPAKSGKRREALTYIHAEVDPAVDVVGPDRSGQRVEEPREHAPEQLRLAGHLRRSGGIFTLRRRFIGRKKKKSFSPNKAN